MGFEPTLGGLRPKRFSRPSHSTALPPLQADPCVSGALRSGQLGRVTTAETTDDRSHSRLTARRRGPEPLFEYRAVCGGNLAGRIPATDGVAAQGSSPIVLFFEPQPLVPARRGRLSSFPPPEDGSGGWVRCPAGSISAKAREVTALGYVARSRRRKRGPLGRTSLRSVWSGRKSGHEPGWDAVSGPWRGRPGRLDRRIIQLNSGVEDRAFRGSSIEERLGRLDGPNQSSTTALSQSAVVPLRTADREIWHRGIRPGAPATREDRRPPQ